MVQSIDFNRPIYNAVNIRIKKPEINAAGSDKPNTVVNDRGIYNAVKINIDNPSVNTEPKMYNYPQRNDMLTYNMLNFNPIPLPQEFPIASAYYETSFILPEKENNKDIITAESQSIKEADKKEAEEKPEVPPANYTTTEAEKGEQISDSGEIQFKGIEQKKPEIVPSEDIKPKVDIALVNDNLENEDFDVQAKQIEEIARVSLENPQNAVPYIVKDVFNNLIKITQKDTSALQAPSEKQIEIRKKIIANVISAEIAKQENKPVQLPYQISNEEAKIATEISPMEQAERNKEYAIYTISILEKVYIDEIQKETGNVVPFTDVPGLSDIVNELRYNPNPGVRTAAVEGLRYIQRPEYKNEIDTILSIAANDGNREVAETAKNTIEKINKA